MALYIEYAADIYSMYLDYFDPQDIHVYSIDESFLDVTSYLGAMGMDKVTLAKFLMNEIANRYHIPSTAGIGTNLYLAKITLDITAKHARDHIGVLDEETYRQTLWDHRPITDFWMVANGTARRLERYGVYDMRGVTQMDTGLMYKTFGKNAEGDVRPAGLLLRIPRCQQQRHRHGNQHGVPVSKAWHGKDFLLRHL